MSRYFFQSVPTLQSRLHHTLRRETYRTKIAFQYVRISHCSMHTKYMYIENRIQRFSGDDVMVTSLTDDDAPSFLQRMEHSY